MTTPHDYQQNYLDAIARGWDEGFRRQLVDLPTGGGKTNIAAWEIEKALKRFERCLFLADQSDLVFQPAKRIEDLIGVKCDIEKAEFHASAIADVTCASVQTLQNRLDKWPKDSFDLIIADEADKSIAASWQKVLNHFDGHARVLGQTATTNRTDKRNLGIYYDNLIALETLQSLILKGFLSPIKILMLPIKITVPDKSHGDYTDEEADEIVTPHLTAIAEAIKQHAYFRKTLVFLPLIKTAEKFDKIAKSIGLNSEYIYGADPFREDKMRRFERNEISVMANAMVLTRGVDLPAVDNIVFARVTKSDTLLKQSAGRGTRVIYAPGVDIRDQGSRIEHIAKGPKPDCLFMDFLYQMPNRLKCRPAHLIAQTDEEAEAITKLAEDASQAMPADIIAQLDLMELVNTATSQREESLRKKLEENKNKAAKTISAEEFAMKYNSLEAAEFEPTMAWETKPVTDKQKKYLGQAGIALESVDGMAHASKLLNLYFANKPLKLASHGQRATMKRMGHPNWENATEQEARQFFAGLKQKSKQPEFI